MRAYYFGKKLLMNQEFRDCLKRMILRENADYKNSFSKSGAIIVLKKAAEFLKIAKDIF